MECKERNPITRVWTSYRTKLTHSTELEQKRFDLRSVPPAGILQILLSQEPREVRRTNKLMFFDRDFLILMLLLQIASMLLVKYFYRRNVPLKHFLIVKTAANTVKQRTKFVAWRHHCGYQQIYHTETQKYIWATRVCRPREFTHGSRAAREKRS